MKYSILLVLLLIVSLNASAQMFSGRVLDDQKIPVQYATVALLSVADSSLISGTVTDEQGIFKIEVSESKPYLLAVSYVGYKRSIQRLMPSISGDIVIIPDDRMLDEVVVTQHLPLYRLDNGGLTTKVENTILSKAGTAMNVAELLPGVLERPDGTLEVLRKGTPLIYINNREVRHLDELDRLSAENIKQVELITNPSAEYGAAVGAVLKLKTVGKKIDGFGIGLRSVADYSYKIGNNDQLNVEYRQNGLDLFGTFQYRLQHLKETG